MGWTGRIERERKEALFGAWAMLCSGMFYSRAVGFGHINSFSKLTLNFVPDPVLDTGNPEMNKM